MRYAVFSDVHSNLEALEAVLGFLAKSSIDKYLFLGDIVGYGANPKECIAALRRLAPVSVAGNHDWATVGLLDTDYFNEAARKAIFWTKDNISGPDSLFLSGLELTSCKESYCLVHGTLNQPQEFDYMIDGYRAQKTFYLLKEKVCFVGHSHRPGVFIEDEERIYYKEPAMLELKEGRRYIVNDGSVGQPRDGDPRACFCIYDEGSSTIDFIRLAYDVTTAQRKIIDAGLPRVLADRLSVGR